MPNSNGWNEYSRLVLSELESLNSCYEKLDVKLSAMREDIAILKIKSSIYGLIGGAIPVAIGLAIYFLKTG